MINATQLLFHHREFEYDIRRMLNKPEGPITVDDAAKVTEIDGSTYSFDNDDIDTLRHFINLESLALEIGNTDLRFLGEFPNLKELYLYYWDRSNSLDFDVFKSLSCLETLFVSGGDISDIAYQNLDALIPLVKLKDLSLHEFGTVDLSFLEKMPWIERFFCGYANKVTSIESISKLINLQSLELVDVEMENLDFLDSLPDEMELDLCADEVHAGIDLAKLNRFAKVDICEMTVNGEPFRTE